MKQYIATFFSHFGAVRFQRLCVERGYEAQLAPVPRRLSSSCGTCVKYEGECPEATPKEVEQIVAVMDDGYKQLYRAENS